MNLNKILFCLAATVATASCVSRQVQAPDEEATKFAFQQREASLAALNSWDMAGKLSIDDGEDGGSGRLSWQVRDDSSVMNFRGALGRGAWQLDTGPGFAELRKADGSVTRAASVRELVESEVGWRVPVDALRWWALGLPAPGGVELLDLDAAGRIIAMQQDGWNVSFNRYRAFGGMELPGRMDAVRGRYRVKMAVSNWTVPPPDADG